MNMASQVQVQIVGIASTFAYTAIVTFILLKLVDSMLGLRINDEDETKGLDLAEHDERGYDL
jgi:Amt family ammonium transporter